MFWMMTWIRFFFKQTLLLVYCHPSHVQQQQHTWYIHIYHIMCVVWSNCVFKRLCEFPEPYKLAKPLLIICIPTLLDLTLVLNKTKSFGSLLVFFIILMIIRNNSEKKRCKHFFWGQKCYLLYNYYIFEKKEKKKTILKWQSSSKKPT